MATPRNDAGALCCWHALLQPPKGPVAACEAQAPMFHSGQGSSRVFALSDGIFPLAGSEIATEKPFVSTVCASNLQGPLLRSVIARLGGT